MIPQDLQVVEYRQLPAYEMADLFADIGGTLGLWMGISVLTIMELVELVIRLMALLFNAERELPGPSINNAGNHSNITCTHMHSNIPNGDVDHERETRGSEFGPSEFDYRRTLPLGVESPV